MRARVAPAPFTEIRGRDEGGMKVSVAIRKDAQKGSQTVYGALRCREPG